MGLGKDINNCQVSRSSPGLWKMQLRLKDLLAATRKQLGIDPSIVWLNGLTLLLFLALGVYVSVCHKGEGLALLFDEPFSYERPYTGFLTRISEVLWCLSATTCLFSFGLLKSFPARRQVDWFILCSGFGLVVLLVDDLFRLTVILHSFAGVPKVLMYLVYGTGAIAYGWYFWRRVLSTPYVLLLVAAVSFIVSGLIDLVHLGGVGLPAILEDGPKLLGLLNIALYFWTVCRQAVLRSFS